MRYLIMIYRHRGHAENALKRMLKEGRIKASENPVIGFWGNGYAIFGQS